jgi:hypothetical protein
MTIIAVLLIFFGIGFFLIMRVRTMKMYMAIIGVLLIILGIAVTNQIVRNDDMLYNILHIETIGRSNFDFFPFPVVHDDGISIQLIHGRGLKMDEDGFFILSPDQTEKFRKLDLKNAKILDVDLDGWSVRRITDIFLEPESVYKLKSDTDGKKFSIYLASAQGRMNCTTQYSFKNDKLKLIYTTKKTRMKSKVMSFGCLITIIVMSGFVFIFLDVFRMIWSRAKKHSYLKSDPVS